MWRRKSSQMEVTGCGGGGGAERGGSNTAVPPAMACRPALRSRCVMNVSPVRNGEIVPDYSPRAGGRRASHHPSRSCHGLRANLRLPSSFQADGEFCESRKDLGMRDRPYVNATNVFQEV